MEAIPIGPIYQINETKTQKNTTIPIHMWLYHSVPRSAETGPGQTCYLGPIPRL